MAEENKVSQRVLELVRLKGPVIPTDISKEINTSSLLASAILSELVSNNNLRITSVKIGGTPLYYAPGQEEKLQNYTKYLHEKERKAYEMLKTASILQDKILEPVIRVALRQIKDFAMPLKVSNNGNVEIFWKWYMLTNDHVEPLIKKTLDVKPPTIEPQQTITPTQTSTHQTTAQQTIEPQQTITPTRKQPTEIKNPEPQVRLKQPIKTPKPKKVAGDFEKIVLDFFRKGKIEVLEKIENTRKTEAEFIISVPSPVGEIKYYCKSKDKKNCNEGDLSTAFVQGQTKKLPVLFITTGSLTKKATEMLSKEFSSINVKKL